MIKLNMFACIVLHNMPMAACRSHITVYTTLYFVCYTYSVYDNACACGSRIDYKFMSEDR